MNRFEESQMNLGGGFSYISIDYNNGTRKLIPTIFKYAPSNTLDSFNRFFGVSYYQTTVALDSNFELDLQRKLP